MFGDYVSWGQYKDIRWNEKDLVKAPTSFLDVTFTEINTKEGDSSHGQAASILPFGKTKLFRVPIKDANILAVADDSKNVIEVELDVKDISCDFLPGDTVGIIPENSIDDVDSLIEMLGLSQVAEKNCVISVKQECTGKRFKLPAHIPQNSTLRKVFRDCVSFTFPPKKQFFRVLYDHSDDVNDRKILGALCARDSKALNCRFNIIEALTYFPSCRPPVDILLENLPRLFPRPYSIANSPLISKDTIKIVFSVLNTNPGQTTKLLQDLAKQFLENPRQQLFVNLYFRERNSFCYTEEEFGKNAIMISVGCAVSPYIGFLQHKAELIKQGCRGPPGKSWIFTGFRHPDVAIYRKELQHFLEKGVLDRMFESFSRDPSCNFKYVQDCILANAEEFVDQLLDANTIVYVCADGADISKSIQRVIEDCIAAKTNCDLEEAKKLVVAFKKDGKYREDIWI